jgi:hypothetical protein
VRSTKTEIQAISGGIFKSQPEIIKNGKIFHILDEIEKHLVVKRSPEYYATENDEHFITEKGKEDYNFIKNNKIHLIYILNTILYK